MPLIILVEDDPTIRELLAEMFEEEGFAAKAFASGDEAWSFLSSFDGDVHMLLTDFSMPGHLDGIHLAHLVRDRFPDLPIVLSSGVLRDTPELDGLGVTVLPKPWSIAQLRPILSAVDPVAQRSCPRPG